MNSAGFRFVFAEREDLFFAKPMLKLDFEQYLYLKLQKEGFQYLYYFSMLEGDEVQVCCENYAELVKYCEKAKKGFRKKASEAPEENRVSVRSGAKRLLYGYRQSRKLVLDTIENLLSEEGVFVFSMRSFHDIFSREDVQKLNRILAKNRYSRQKYLFLFVENESYDGLLPYLPESVLPENEIQEINAGIGADTFYGRLQAKNLNCEKWEAFQYEQIQRMVQRAYLDRTMLVENTWVKQMTDYLYQYLVEKKLRTMFGIKMDMQKNLFQKILLDDGYMHQLERSSASQTASGR